MDDLELNPDIETRVTNRQSKYSPDALTMKGIIKTLKSNKQSENVLEIVQQKYGSKAVDHALTSKDVDKFDKAKVLKLMEDWSMQPQERKKLFRAKVNELAFQGNIDAIKIGMEDPEVGLRGQQSTQTNVQINFTPELMSAMQTLPELPPLEVPSTPVLDVTSEVTEPQNKPE